MPVLDPTNSPELLEQLGPHALSTDFEVVWCSEGCMPLIRDCHLALAAAFPEYRFYAIKPKFGVRSYQARPPGRAADVDESQSVHRITDELTERSATIYSREG